jgi:hypothetical protein
MRTKDEFAPIPKCMTCTESCKKYINVIILHAFETGDAYLICPRFNKIKEPKTGKKGVKS